MVGQPGFFDLSDRYAALSAAGDPLERLAAVVDFLAAGLVMGFSGVHVGQGLQGVGVSPDVVDGVRGSAAERGKVDKNPVFPAIDRPTQFRRCQRRVLNFYFQQRRQRQSGRSGLKGAKGAGRRGVDV